MKKSGLKASLLPSHATLALALVITCSATVSLADSASDRAACTPDVFRLCSSDIPNVDRIVACLNREKPRLSVGCQAVMTASASRTATATRSVTAPDNPWCQFRAGEQGAEQQSWLAWCGPAARKQ